MFKFCYYNTYGFVLFIHPSFTSCSPCILFFPLTSLKPLEIVNIASYLKSDNFVLIGAYLLLPSFDGLKIFRFYLKKPMNAAIITALRRVQNHASKNRWESIISPASLLDSRGNFISVVSLAHLSKYDLNLLKN